MGKRAAAIGFDRDAYTARLPFSIHDRGVPTWLYVMSCREFHKIGIAADVKKRHAALQIANPITIQVVGVQEYPTRLYALLVERTIHDVLKEHWHTGEWFTADIDHVLAVFREVHSATEVLLRRHRKIGLRATDGRSLTPIFDTMAQ